MLINQFIPEIKNIDFIYEKYQSCGLDGIPIEFYKVSFHDFEKENISSKVK